MTCKCKNMSCVCDLSDQDRNQQYHDVINRMENQGIVSPSTAQQLHQNADNATGSTGS